MSDLVLDRADLFSVGTVVKARAIASGDGDGGAVIDSATVASNGTLTFTSLIDGVAYVLSDGTSRLRIRKASAAAAGTTWKDRVAARRAAIGTS